MALPLPLNLEKWIEDHREDFVPPAGGKTIWEDTDFIVTVIGGPNDRPDYHDDPLEEFFYQLKGDITLRVIDDNKRQDVPIREGEIFLLPPRVLHSPQRPANTLGLIVERQRPPGVIDAFEWFCDKCDARVHRVEVQIVDLEPDLNRAVNAYYDDPKLRSCSSCGNVNPRRGERAMNMGQK